MPDDVHGWRDYVDDDDARRDITAARAAELFLARIAARSDLQAVVTVDVERALLDAERADAARARGRPLPLDGMPVLVKDNVDVAGLPCRVGSPLFEHRVSRGDATVVHRISAAGGVVLGKSALHELSYGATTDSEFYGRTRNPWSPDRTVGGSSGGSAAAVAAGLCVAAIGTDTGGSIRLPAHLNGVVGLRPTYGTVSAHGVVPISPTLDTVGVLARRAHDAVALHHVVVGPDWADEHAVERPPTTNRPIERAVLAGPRTLGDLEPGVAEHLRSTVELLRALGVVVEVVELDGFAQARADGRTITLVEAWTRYRGDLARRPASFSTQTTERLEAGQHVSGAQLTEASWRTAVWRRDVRRLLAEHDVLVLPVAPVATPIADGEGMLRTTSLLTSYTLPISTAWVPALSVPTGTVEGMPAGLQVAAAPGRDDDLLDLAVRLEQCVALPWPPG